jgi:hypothetical protein
MKSLFTNAVATWAFSLGISAQFYLSEARAEAPAGSPSVELPSQTDVNGYAILGWSDSGSRHGALKNAGKPGG